MFWFIVEKFRSIIARISICIDWLKEQLAHASDFDTAELELAGCDDSAADGNPG